MMEGYKENIKNKVLALIKAQNEFSFTKLMKSTDLSFIELSAIIGLLLQEKKISLYVNHIHTSDKRVQVSQVNRKPSSWDIKGAQGFPHIAENE